MAGQISAAPLRKALALAEPRRQQVILFLTSGLPTEGEVRTNALIEQITEDAPDNVRIFCFGVGYDVNTILLDVVSQEHSGTSAYVLPDEDIERVVSSLYDKIRQPVLTDVTVELGLYGVEAVRSSRRSIPTRCRTSLPAGSSSSWGATGCRGMRTLGPLSPLTGKPW